MSLRLGTFVDTLGGELHGDPDQFIEGLAALESAQHKQLSFLSHPRYQRLLQSTQAACIIVSPDTAAAAIARGMAIVAPDPYLYFARATQLWRRHTRSEQKPGIHASACIDPSAQIHSSAYIGPLCVVEAGAIVGENTILKSRVTVGESCKIGQNCIMHSGVVIGADGFGFAPNAGRWEKIEQLGAVVIGNNVEIGANTCVDRGALSDTVISEGVKIDNLVQIGHNVKVGAHTAIAGCAGVAGSAQIGARCTIGGGAVVLGHLTIADEVHISAATVVTRSIHKPGHYTGIFPMDENTPWEKNAATLKQLYGLRERIKSLEKLTQS